MSTSRASPSSTLEDRIRYTPSSAFETFPWPAENANAAEAIGELVRQLLVRRAAICAEAEIGLTELYNQAQEGAWTDLPEMHDALDAAVLAAYGWEDADPHDTATINSRLFELNQVSAAADSGYVGPPTSLA